MNGRKAKAIRKEVYGENMSPRHREYRWVKLEFVDRRFRRRVAYRLETTGLRRAYQNAKKQKQRAASTTV